MAYTKQYIINKSLEAIEKYKIIFVTEIFAFVEFDQATFYRKQCEHCEVIKNAIAKNRIEIKKSLQKKWHASDNATTQIALYKLTGTDDERDILNTQKIDHTNKGEKFDFDNTNTDELLSRIGKLLSAKKPEEQG
jgi:hypothetical protein